MLDVHRKRFLARIANRGYAPTDYRKLRQEYASRFLSAGCMLNSSRIATAAIELDFFAPDEAVAKSLLSSFDGVLTFQQLEREQTGSPEEIMDRALELFNDERFWEVHETVESLWKKSKGKEREALQSIILFSAALVHYQKDEEDVALRMIRRSLEKMPSQTVYSFDLSKLRREGEAMLALSRIHIPKLSRPPQ